MKLWVNASYECKSRLHIFWMFATYKLDGVGLVDNRPYIDKLHHFVRKKRRRKSDKWEVTFEMWHVTHDMWHMTRDTRHVKCLGGWTFSQNFSSLALTVCDLCYYKDLEEKAHWLNESMNYDAVYRTVPATPGLLKSDLLCILMVCFHRSKIAGRFSCTSELVGQDTTSMWSQERSGILSYSFWLSFRRPLPFSEHWASIML